MKKLLVIIAFLIALALPLLSFAAVFIVPQGGTGVSTFNSGGVLYSEGGTRALKAVATSTNTVLSVDSSGTLTWVSTSSLNIAGTGDGTFSTTSANYFINASSTIAHPGNASLGNLIHWDGSSWQAIATSSLKILLSDTTGTLTVAKGGTGATSLTGLLQGNGTSAFTAITDSSTVGQILRTTGASTYAWGALDLADGDAITGTLGVANGGTGITSFGAGVATWLGSPTAANLRTAVTGTTGSGNLVFATGPTLSNTVLSGTVTDTNSSVGAFGELLSSTGAAVDWLATSTLNINHTDLKTLGFTASGHTGTAFRLFGTNSSGAAAEYATSSLKILLSDNIGVLGIAQGGLNAAFTDPNADQLMFWDDSAAAITGIGTLSGAAISGTTLTINDVTCTDCLTTTEIADSYLLNNGDAGTGVFDFGGATSFEIVNGTAPTLSNIGDVAFDTTDMQLLIATTTANTPVVYPSVQKLWGVTVASTSVDFVSGGRMPIPPQRDGVVITEVHCFVDGGTSKVINLDTMAGGAQLDSLTCATTLTSDTAQSANYSLAAGALMALEFGATTGVVDYVTISVWGKVTRE